MLIDLNGMWFHLNIHDGGTGPGTTGVFHAEIADESFQFGVMRGEVRDLDCVAALIRRYSGLSPTAEALSQIASRLTRLRRARAEAAAPGTTPPLAEAG